MKRLRLILTIFVCVAAVSAHSIENPEGPDKGSFKPVLLNSAQNTDQPFDDPNLQKIYDYRMSVEETAYETTRKLCKAYLVLQHQYSYDSTRDQEINFQYLLSMYSPYPPMFAVEYPSLSHLEDISLKQSLKEWSNIAGHGLAQPFSAMFGHKSRYLTATQKKLSQWDSWFKSLYTIFLVQSWGFEQSAEECLGDRQSIPQFADTIIRFDSWSSAPSHILNFTIGTAVFTGLFKIIAWMARPVTKPIKASYSKLKQEMAKLKPQTQKRLKIGGWSTAGAGVAGGASLITASTLNRLEEKKKNQQEVQALLDSAPSLTKDQKERFQILIQARNLLSSLATAEISDQTISEYQMMECIICDENYNPLYEPFYKLLLENFDEKTIFLIKEDRSFLMNQKDLDDSLSLIYLRMINEYLPLIEEMLLIQTQEV